MTSQPDWQVKFLAIHFMALIRHWLLTSHCFEPRCIFLYLSVWDVPSVEGFTMLPKQLALRPNCFSPKIKKKRLWLYEQGFTIAKNIKSKKKLVILGVILFTKYFV